MRYYTRKNTTLGDLLKFKFSANLRAVRKASKIAEQVGLNLLVLRRKKKLSQEQLGDKAGLDRTYISDIERGQRNISIETMAKLARALHCQLTDLVDGIELKGRK